LKRYREHLVWEVLAAGPVLPGQVVLMEHVIFRKI